MELEFEAEVVAWRGPAPYLFAVLPQDQADAIADVARQASYGWGCIAVAATIGDTDFSTSLMPRSGGYLLPVKKAVQLAEGVTAGVRVRAVVRLPR